MTPSTRPPLALLVDLDGTLYRPRPVKLAMAVELLFFGLSKARLLRTFRHVHEELRAELHEDPQVELRPSPFAVQLQRAATRLRMDIAELEPIVRSWMFERPGRHIRRARREALIEELEQFRAAGGRLALVSDYPAQEKLRALGLEELFEVVVASGEFPGLRRLKPAPDGFLAAAEALDVEPRRCLVLGDREDADGDAAARAGMAFRLIK